MTSLVKPCIAAVLGVASIAAVAGPAEVQYLGADHFADAGRSPIDRDHNLKQLSTIVQQLSQRYLPAQRTLKLEVTDLDLAGEPQPTTRGDLRVARGKADPPRITFRYTVQEGGQVVAQGQESLTDLDYANHLPDIHTSEPLHFERRVLETWFKQRFGGTPS